MGCPFADFPCSWLFPRRYLRLAGPGRPSSGEFWDSWLAREPLLFCRNVVYWSKGREFRVGKTARTADGQIVRLERLLYAPGAFTSGVADAHIPPLRVLCSTFVVPSFLPAGLRPKRAGSPGGLVHIAYDCKEFEPDQLVSLIDLAEPDSKAAVGTPHCRFAVDVDKTTFAKKLVEYQRITTLYTFNAIAQHHPFAWLTLFIDGTSIRSSRARSTTSVYVSFAGLPERYNALGESIFPIMHIPPGVELYEVISLVWLSVSNAPVSSLLSVALPGIETVQARHSATGGRLDGSGVLLSRSYSRWQHGDLSAFCCAEAYDNHRLRLPWLRGWGPHATN